MFARGHAFTLLVLAGTFGIAALLGPAATSSSAAVWIIIGVVGVGAYVLIGRMPKGGK